MGSKCLVLVQADVQYGRHVDHAQDKYNSIVFNAFIFLQLFNQINARKIKDELNVFKGELACLSKAALTSQSANVSGSPSCLYTLPWHFLCCMNACAAQALARCVIDPIAA